MPPAAETQQHGAKCVIGVLLMPAHQHAEAAASGAFDFNTREFQLSDPGLRHQHHDQGSAGWGSGGGFGGGSGFGGGGAGSSW